MYVGVKRHFQWDRKLGTPFLILFSLPQTNHPLPIVITLSQLTTLLQTTSLTLTTPSPN